VGAAKFLRQGTKAVGQQNGSDNNAHQPAFIWQHPKDSLSLLRQLLNAKRNAMRVSEFYDNSDSDDFIQEHLAGVGL
jgi:hypothetical protein